MGILIRTIQDRSSHSWMTTAYPSQGDLNGYHFRVSFTIILGLPAWKRLFTEIGSGFQQVKWCYRPERGTPKFPYRNLYIHATAQTLCFGEITRYHQAKDLVGAAFWFIPGFQTFLRGDTIVLQAKSVMDIITLNNHTDPALLDKFPTHLC